MEHLSHLVGAYSRIIHLDCLFAYLFRILSPLCFRRICLFAMSADIPLRSAARESHLPLLCCCSAFRAFLLFLFHASIILLLHTFCQLPRYFGKQCAKFCHLQTKSFICPYPFCTLNPLRHAIYSASPLFVSCHIGLNIIRTITGIKIRQLTKKYFAN